MKNRRTLFFGISCVVICMGFALPLFFGQKPTYRVLVSSSLSWKKKGYDNYLLALSSFRRLMEPSTGDVYELKSLSSPRYLSPNLLRLTISTGEKSTALAQIDRKLQSLNQEDSGFWSGDLGPDLRAGKAKILDTTEIWSPPFYLRGLQVLVLCGVLYMGLFVVPLIPVRTLLVAVALVSTVVLYKVSSTWFSASPQFAEIRIQTPDQLWEIEDREYIHPEDVAYSLLRSRFDEGEIVSILPEPESRTLRGLIKVIEPGGLPKTISEVRSLMSQVMSQSGANPKREQFLEAVQVIPGTGRVHEMNLARSRMALLVISLAVLMVSAVVFVRSWMKS